MSGRARSFGRLAAEYDRLRPGYPSEVLRPVVGTVVVDVGAGTGKLSTALARSGRRVVAVEPDPEMRSVLVGRGLPGVEVVDGAAERLPVDTGVASAVVYGQSWHWAEPVAAAAEARRVLVDDGLLLLLSNMPDVSVDWVRELNRLAGLPEELPDVTAFAVEGFTAGPVTRVPWDQSLAVDDLVALFSTFSRVSTREPADRERVLRSIRSCLAGHPATAGREVVAYPYVCVGLPYRRS
ncbi:methyltransferase domain-containing protein [Actinomycetospora sp. CA-084318]|uniref:methyltransferase domain-containing protein n=1 Tax=Actinomycetospora sp. CA-084318 TaxID=3239892 RepID=UPI003D98254B